MGTRKPQGSAAEEPHRRKRYHLPQDKIDAAKAILGTGTDSETIERALEAVAALHSAKRRLRDRPRRTP